MTPKRFCCVCWWNPTFRCHVFFVKSHHLLVNGQFCWLIKSQLLIRYNLLMVEFRIHIWRNRNCLLFKSQFLKVTYLKLSKSQCLDSFNHPYFCFWHVKFSWTKIVCFLRYSRRFPLRRLVIFSWTGNRGGQGSAHNFQRAPGRRGKSNGDSQARWMVFRENPIYKWMITGGFGVSPVLGPPPYCKRGMFIHFEWG